MPIMGGVAEGRYVALLAALFAIVWLGLAIEPRYRGDWALENVLTVLAVALLALTRRVPFSPLSYTLVFLFLTFHAVGAHYTYSEVPYDAWFTALTGKSLNRTLGWQRNNFDRIVHFLYGLLLTQTVREAFVHATGFRGFWGYFLPMDLTMSSSATYELIEWGAAMVFGGELGIAYVGAQGDPWDAQKDMSLAALGALLSTVTAATCHRCRTSGHDPLRRSAPSE
jgi:putative membrane protein